MAVLAAVGVLRVVSFDDAGPPSLPGADVAFVSDRGGGPAIWTGRLGDDRFRRFSQGPEARAPAWRPDGAALAYVTRDGATFALRVASYPSGRPRTLLSLDEPVSGFSWAPDGKRIVFDRTHEDGSQDLVVLDVERGTQRSILKRTTRSLSGPAWRPGAHGDILALVEVTNGGHVRVIDIDGRLRWRSKDETYAPSWSSDGARLAFVRWRDQAWDIVVAGADGSHQRVVWRDERLLYAPSWTPDGNWLVFERYRDEAPDLWAVPTSGGEARPVTERPGFDGSPAIRPATGG